MIPSPLHVSDLIPGDGLVFTGDSPFDQIEKIKLGTPATHFEVFIGAGKTVTAKPENGVNIYDLDLNGIYRVIRPVQPFDAAGAMDKFNRTIRGLPYGFAGLLNFLDENVPDRGLFCSETGTEFYRGGNVEPFNRMLRSAHVAPAYYIFIHESIFSIEYQA